MDENKDVIITHETLFEIFRREKDRLELQKLDNSFFNDVFSYLKEKQNLVEGKENQQELFTEEERIKTEKQLKSIKLLLRDVYEKREKKIINMALDKSRTKSDLMDTSSLLDQETNLFESLVKTLDNYRENVLLKLLNTEQPNEVESKQEQKTEEEPAPEPKKEVPKLEEPKEKEESEETTPEQNNVPATEEKSTKLIRFKHAVPKFVGLEGEELGPFEEEDIASLPKEIADVLINKQRAEEIKED